MPESGSDVEQIYRLTLELTAGIMAIGTALCWLIPGGLIGLFTENPETVTIGITALHIISLGFILSAVSVTSSGALEALGRGMASPGDLRDAVCGGDHPCGICAEAA